MGQGSLLTVFAYGGLTFRLRFAYGPDWYFFGFAKSLNYTIRYRYNTRHAISKIGFQADLSYSQQFTYGSLTAVELYAWLTLDLTDTLRTSAKSLRRVWILVSGRCGQYIWNLERCSPQFTSYGIFKPPFPHWLYWFHDINAIWIQFKHLLEPCSHRMSPRLHPSAIIQSHHDTTLAENPSDRLVHVQFNLFRVGLYGSFLCCQSLENGPMSPMDSWDENTKFEVWHNILS